MLPAARKKSGATAVPPVFDASASGNANGSLTFSLSTGVANGTVLLAVGTNTSGASATLDGVSGTLIGSYSTSFYCFAWTGVPATTGTPHSIVVTRSGGSVVAAAASYGNVTTIGPWNAATGTNAATVAANTTDVVVSMFGNASGSAITATSGTLRKAITNSFYNAVGIVDATGSTSIQNKAANATASGSVKLS